MIIALDDSHHGRTEHVFATFLRSILPREDSLVSYWRVSSSLPIAASLASSFVPRVVRRDVCLFSNDPVYLRRPVSSSRVAFSFFSSLFFLFFFFVSS